MHLYKISQTRNRDWDTYTAAIVAAESAEEAVLIHPNGGGQTYESTLEYPGPLRDNWQDEWAAPCHIQVEYIGEAKDGTQKGVILANYRAG